MKRKEQENTSRLVGLFIRAIEKQKGIDLEKFSLDIAEG